MSMTICNYIAAQAAFFDLSWCFGGHGVFRRSHALLFSLGFDSRLGDVARFARGFLLVPISIILVSSIEKSSYVHTSTFMLPGKRRWAAHLPIHAFKSPQEL
jgi:hypothetical protein